MKIIYSLIFSNIKYNSLTIIILMYLKKNEIAQINSGWAVYINSWSIFIF